MPTLFCGPVPGPVPGVRAPRWISGRLKARSAQRGRGAMCWLPSSRWAHDQPRGHPHVDPHAIGGGAS